MVGRRESLAQRKQSTTIGFLQQSSRITFTFQALSAPQSLTADEVYAVIDWLLHLMWITRVGHCHRGTASRKYTRHGFVPDPRPDGRGP
jgi:hypothetical protein